MMPGMGGGAPPGGLPAILQQLHAGQPGQPPFGGNPLTMPVPNQGHEVEAIALIEGVQTALKEALRLLEPGSKIFKTVNRVMEELQRDVPAAQVTPGIQRSAMLRFMMAQRRENPMLGMLAAQGGGGQQPPGAQPPGASPMPVPPPSAAAAGAA